MSPQQSSVPGLHLPPPASNTPQAGGELSMQSEPSVQATPQPATASVPASNADTADEATIDQQWIAQSREVVRQYRSDPYLQSLELSKLKAQYLKVRYNKDIKVSEDK